MRGWGSAEPGQLGLAAVVAGHGVVATQEGWGAWRPPRATGELGFGNTGGARGWFGSGCDAWGGQVASPAYGVARRPSAGRREVEEPASGNFVIRPKFQNPVL